jgi:hypothetical protein
MKEAKPQKDGHLIAPFRTAIGPQRSTYLLQSDRKTDWHEQASAKYARESRLLGAYLICQDDP